MKYRNLFLLLTAWEGLVWLGYNGHLLRTRIWILFDVETIYEGFYLGGDYYNAGTYLLILAITSVMAVEYCLKEESVPELVRCRSRTDFVGRRWRTLAAVSLLYAAVHFAMGYGLSRALFDGALTNTRQTAFFYFVSTPLLFCFFLRVNVVYTFLRDLFRKKLFAIAGILALYLAEYFSGYYILTGVWMPCKDVDMGRAAYFGRVGAVELLLALVRQCGITAMAIVLSTKYFERKDVIQLER